MKIILAIINITGIITITIISKRHLALFEDIGKCLVPNHLKGSDNQHIGKLGQVAQKIRGEQFHLILLWQTDSILMKAIGLHPAIPLPSHLIDWNHLLPCKAEQQLSAHLKSLR